MKKIIAVLLLLTLALSACTALADGPRVEYRGRAKNFVFIEDEDLFDSFKNLLPGDEATQAIKVRNESDHRVRIYMHAETEPTESVAGFLDSLHMTVECRNKEIFDAAPAQNAQLTKPTLLGTFGRNGGNTTLDVKLEIPFELDNAYQFAKGEVVWVFTVEELPDDDSPDTGDDFVMTLWLGVAAALLAAIAAVLVLLRKRRNEA